MKIIRILSAVLAILLAFSAIGLPVFAADATVTAETKNLIKELTEANPVVDPVEIGEYAASEEWISQKFKVYAMRTSVLGTKYDADGYGAIYKDANWALYVDILSAEFALVNLKTAEVTFSNPYDIAINAEFPAATTEDYDDPIRQALLSQIILTYEDVETGATYTMKSYTDAVLAGDQIIFEQIEGGIRVEYAIGTVETKRLFPQWIEKERFETQIYAPIKAYYDDV